MLRLPEKTKPTKVLQKRAPSNTVDAERSSGYLLIDEETDTAEMHVSDGKRVVILPLVNDGTNLRNFRSGQFPAPAIALLEKGGALVQAKDDIEIEDEANEATVTFHRDTQLFDGGGDLHLAIPTNEEEPWASSVHLNATRLLELAKALGSEKLTLHVSIDGSEIRVEPFDGAGIAALRPLERNAAPAPEDNPDQTSIEDEPEGAEPPEETIPEDERPALAEVPPEDDPDKDLTGSSELTPEEEAEWGEPEA